MSDALMADREIIVGKARDLWQGREVDMEELNEAIQNASEVILHVSDNLQEEDTATTIEYIKNGLQEYNIALEHRDSFLMADCLYYTWRELITIYLEALMGA